MVVVEGGGGEGQLPLVPHHELIKSREGEIIITSLFLSSSVCASPRKREKQGAWEHDRPGAVELSPPD